MQSLLRRHFEEVEALPGSYAVSEVIVNLSTPDQVARILLRRPQYRLSQWWWKMEQKMGALQDYIDEDPAVSCRRILKHRASHPQLSQLVERVERSDAVVIDGNGDMIFKSAPTRNLLFNLALIELARKIGRPVHYVNALVADCSRTGHNEDLARRCVQMLRKCDLVSVRDPRSKDVLAELAPDINAPHVPDSLFAWYPDVQEALADLPDRGDFLLPFGFEIPERLGELRFDEPYICVSGGSRAAWNPTESAKRYIKLVKELQKLGYPVYLVPTCGGDHFLQTVAEQTSSPLIPGEISVFMGGAILAKAQLFLSGRYHPSILAALGGTPCVFFEPDSHKVLSLQAMLGYDDPQHFNAAPREESLDGILDRVRDLLSRSHTMRDQIQAHARQCYEATLELPNLIDAATSGAGENAPTRPGPETRVGV